MEDPSGLHSSQKVQGHKGGCSSKWNELFDIYHTFKKYNDILHVHISSN